REAVPVRRRPGVAGTRHAPARGFRTREGLMRTFEYSDGKSDKFWNIELQGKQFTVTFGRKGTKGQTQTKKFPDAAKAQKEHDNCRAERTPRGCPRNPPRAGAAPPRRGGAGGRRRGGRRPPPPPPPPPRGWLPPTPSTSGAPPGACSSGYTWRWGRNAAR